MNQRGVAKLLIFKGADVNAKDRDGWTPMHKAIALGFFKNIVELLIAKGANVNAKDNEGRTPLDYALIRAADLNPDTGCALGIP